MFASSPSKKVSYDAIDRELHAYNAAFYQLGLRWHWDRETHEQLLAISSIDVERVRWYLRNHQPHLLTAYDAEFLANVIEKTKDDCRKTMRDSALRPCKGFNWADFGAAEIGV